ncbi:MAG: zincin-like metallopeptidase domain-containing protein [Synechococcaceae cyanobacterium]|nr:zincin-like metallopeptidase domain-containing protein [Synechococcaceae cyanobacterium]
MPSPSPRPSPEQKLVASLVALLEAGTNPWRRPWDGSGGGHHCNLFSGRRYRGANPALLSLGLQLRGSSLPYWCGFAEARAHGLVPRRGSQAVYVLRPQPVAATGTAAAAEPHRPDGAAGASAAVGGSAEAAAERLAAAGTADPPGPTRQRLRFRPVPVFNALDLQGEALQGLIRARRQAAGAVQRPEPERLAAAEQVLGAWPVPVSHGGDRACYIPGEDRIVLPVRAAFHDAASLYATWAHEAIHSSGHRSRLGRDLSGAPGSASYAREELVAELGASLLGDRLEIGSDVHQHAAYLADWLALLQASPRLLFPLLSQARQAADLICPEPLEPPESPPAPASAASACCAQSLR